MEVHKISNRAIQAQQSELELYNTKYVTKHVMQ